MDPIPVFEAVRQLQHTLETKPGVSETDRLILGEVVRYMKGHDERVVKLKDDVSKTTVQSFEPLIKLFGILSSDKSKPGDLLEQEIMDIKEQLQKLREAAVPGQQPAGMQTRQAQSGFNWTIPPKQATSFTGTAPLNRTQASQGGSRVPCEVPSQANVGGANPQIANLEQRLQNIEDQMISQRVELGGETFKSLSFTKAWLSTNASSRLGYIFFADAHSLLTMASVRSVIDTAEYLDYRSSAVKSGFDSSQEASIVASFEIELPAFFGKDPSGTQAVSDARVLPAVKSFKDWDAGDAYTGARYRFDRQVGAASRFMRRGAENQLQGVGLLLALEAISRSQTFLVQLANWISRQHTDLTNRGGSTKHAWELISHCVRAIFTDLHKAREYGVGPFEPGDQPAGVMWGCVQGLRRMQEYADADFSAHPKLSHILNIHLQDNALMKSTFAQYKMDTNKKIEELSKSNDKLVKALDGLTSKVNKKT